MLDGLSLLFPCFVAQRESKRFAHEILVDDRIEVSFFVVLVLGDVEVLDHGWVLHEHADHACIDDHDDRVVAGIERLTICSCELV